MLYVLLWLSYARSLVSLLRTASGVSKRWLFQRTHTHTQKPTPVPPVPNLGELVRTLSVPKCPCHDKNDEDDDLEIIAVNLPEAPQQVPQPVPHLAGRRLVPPDLAQLVPPTGEGWCVVILQKLHLHAHIIIYII